MTFAKIPVKVLTNSVDPVRHKGIGYKGNFGPLFLQQTNIRIIKGMWQASRTRY